MYTAKGLRRINKQNAARRQREYDQELHRINTIKEQLYQIYMEKVGEALQSASSQGKFEYKTDLVPLDNVEDYLNKTRTATEVIVEMLRANGFKVQSSDGRPLQLDYYKVVSRNYDPLIVIQLKIEWYKNVSAPKSYGSRMKAQGYKWKYIWKDKKFQKQYYKDIPVCYDGSLALKEGTPVVTVREPVFH